MIPANSCLLFTSKEDELFISERMPSNVLIVKRIEDSLVWVVPNGVDLDSRIQDDSNRHLERYLDKFYLLLPTHQHENAFTIKLSFFEFIASDYENLVEISRNLENITFIVDTICGLVGEQAKPIQLIDFGCGTGLSAFVKSKREVEIIGIDASTEMVKISTGKNMRVVLQSELSDAAMPMVDAAFSSYVMHFCPPREHIFQIWERIRPSGYFMANLHKSIGLEHVIDCFLSFGGRRINLLTPDYLLRHGDYFVFQKG
jgi:SAM-dependent methyltransferase